MIAKKVTNGEADLRDPASSVWRSVREEIVNLTPTPLGLQPSPYIVVSRATAEIGRVKRVRVRSAHNGSVIGFHLEWEDSSREVEMTDTDVFPDGAGILFPLKGDAPLTTMGEEKQPVTAWHWRADRPEHARNNVAAGLGTTRVTDERLIAVSAVWEKGRWRVAFTRALQIPAPSDEAIQFRVGSTMKVAFAVWEGSNGERAGIKAFSPEWQPLTVEA
jgi:DMSO reductase family type II enzyme heme b subunit